MQFPISYDGLINGLCPSQTHRDNRFAYTFRPIKRRRCQSKQSKEVDVEKKTFFLAIVKLAIVKWSLPMLWKPHVLIHLDVRPYTRPGHHNDNNLL